jgi:hypothetical protein
MKNRTLSALLFASALVCASSANAATFTPRFSDYAFPGSLFTVDAAANTFFSAAYGINVSNAYLYKDSRDTFDGIGVANGPVSGIGSPQTGRVSFLDTTDFVTVDYLAILATTYTAFSSSGVQLASFNSPGNTSNGTFTLNGGGDVIAYLTFSSSGGYGTISSLTYNYDGTTGNGNTDLPNVPAVPEPETYAMMLAGLGLVGAIARRRKQNSAAV